MILYIVMLALYVTVTIFQMFAIVKQRRRNLLVYLFTLSLVMHCSSYFLSTIHKVVFAQNGIGYKTLSIISDIIRITSLGLFIIFALIISKGWPMTRSTVTGKPLLLLAFLTYIIMELILIVWIKVTCVTRCRRFLFFHHHRLMFLSCCIHVLSFYLFTLLLELTGHR